MNPPTMLCEVLAAHLRPPQVNGAEHYDVDCLGRPAGRLTRRNGRNKRPTPGWYVCLQEGSRILRSEDGNVAYYPTPEEALKALWDALATSPDDLPS